VNRRTPGRRSAQKRRRATWIAIVASALGHLAILYGLLLLLGGERHGRDRAHRGSYILVSDDPATDEIPRFDEHSPDQVRPAQRPRPRASLDRTDASASPTKATALSSEILAGEPQADETGASEPGDSGDSPVLTLSSGPIVGQGAPPSSTDPSPECLDGLDNDGDRLTDHEDPQCWPVLPEQEFVSKRTGAILLSDMRQNDLIKGDPDVILSERIVRRLLPYGDDLVYSGRTFTARIGRTGEVSFDERSKLRGAQGLALGVSRARPSDLERRRFMEATEEIRAERQAKAADRRVKLALMRLGADLDTLWADGSLSFRHKKAILFERLDECDLESPGGRRAAKTIINFIRQRFRSRGLGG